MTIGTTASRDVRSIWTERAILGLFALAAAMMVVARFQNVNGVVLPFLQQAANPALYSQDFYIRHAIVDESSLVFVLLRWLRLDVTTPVPVLFLYGASTLVGGLGIWRILTGPLGVAGRTTAAMLLFLAVFADFKLMEFHKGGWIVEHGVSPTMLAVAGRFWFVYALLSGRMTLMTALLIPINLLAFKVGWPLVAIAGAVLLWKRVRSPWPWLLLIVSMAAPAWSALTSQAPLEPGEARFVFDTLRAAYPVEDNPFAQSPVAILLLLAGMALLWFAAPRFEAAAALGLRAVAVVATGVFLVGGLWLTLGDIAPPLPLVVLLSPARALETAALSAYLVALCLVARDERFAAPERALLLLALAVLKVTPDLKWVGLGFGLAGAAALLWVVRQAMARRFPVFGGVTVQFGARSLIAIAAPMISAVFLFNLTGDRVSQTWTPGLGFRPSDAPASTASLMERLRADPNDRIILFLTPTDEGYSVENWNALARKSGLLGRSYYLDSRSTILELDRRSRIVQSLAEGRSPTESETDEASRLNVNVVLPTRAVSAFAGWRISEDFGAWKEIAPQD